MMQRSALLYLDVISLWRTDKSHLKSPHSKRIKRQTTSSARAEEKRANQTAAEREIEQVPIYGTISISISMHLGVFRLLLVECFR